MGNTTARYLPHGPFHAELQRRVGLYFERTGLVANDARGMVLKSLVMLAWFAGSYALLMFVATTAWQAALLSVSLGLAMAGIGFNVQHDGGHGAYSRRRWVNTLSAAGLDLLGGSSYVWSWKHNVFHHSNPNVVGLDADIDIQPFCRLAPAQKRLPLHRYQHLYIFFLYGFLAAKWHFLDDFRDVGMGRIGELHFPRPRGWKLAGFLFGKALFFTWAVVLPFALHPVLTVLPFFIITSATVSLALAVTFQLAHVTEEAFSTAGDASEAPKTEWAVHQVESSRNFAPQNRLLAWYIGGLNFQIEHHLFPRVSHLHLRGVSEIVQATCREFGVAYRVHPTVGSALASHVRWVRSLGAPLGAT